jgi:shikimate kinase
VSKGRTVWLVGMMGAGKSRLGPALARRLGRLYVDTDAEIERSEGRSISEIFAREGECAFRELERAEIDLWAGEAAVVALGGGAVAEPGARERLAGAGTVVYLRARPDTLVRRLGDCGGRPLLSGLDPTARLARLADLLAERREAYESAAIRVDTDDAEPGELVEALARRIEAAETP